MIDKKAASPTKWLILTFVGVVLLDQITKIFARIYLKPVQSVAVISDFFRLTYVENPGIAFGIRVDNKVFFTVLSIAAVIVLFYYLIKLREDFSLRLAFAVILGGAVGNLIDRFLFGKVTDFFDFEFFDVHLPSFKFLFFNFQGYHMNRWPVFNVADMAVSLGMLFIIIHALRPVKRYEDDPEIHEETS